jgi:hypothetical protein
MIRANERARFRGLIGRPDCIRGEGVPRVAQVVEVQASHPDLGNRLAPAYELVEVPTS